MRAVTVSVCASAKFADVISANQSGESCALAKVDLANIAFLELT